MLCNSDVAPAAHKWIVLLIEGMETRLADPRVLLCVICSHERSPEKPLLVGAGPACVRPRPGQSLPVPLPSWMGKVQPPRSRLGPGLASGLSVATSSSGLAASARSRTAPRSSVISGVCGMCQLR